MTKFEEHLLADLEDRIARLGREQRLFFQHAALAARAGSETAAEYMVHYVARSINMVCDGVVSVAKESLAYYCVGKAISTLIQNEFNQVSVEKMTDYLIEKLSQSV